MSKKQPSPRSHKWQMRDSAPPDGGSRKPAAPDLHKGTRCENLTHYPPRATRHFREVCAYCCSRLRVPGLTHIIIIIQDYYYYHTTGRQPLSKKHTSKGHSRCSSPGEKSQEVPTHPHRSSVPQPSNGPLKITFSTDRKRDSRAG